MCFVCRCLLFRHLPRVVGVRYDHPTSGYTRECRDGGVDLLRELPGHPIGQNTSFLVSALGTLSITSYVFLPVCAVGRVSVLVS